MEIGFGTWSWGNKFLWGYSPEKNDAILKETFHIAIENGLKLIDTADTYGTGNLTGRSEQLLGEYIAELPPYQRNNILVATKLAPYPWRIGRRGFENALRNSKERLKNKLDRVQLHWSTARYAPWQEEQLIEGLCDFHVKGDIAEIGVSNMGPIRLLSFHKRLKERGIPLKSIQIQFSLLAPQQQQNSELKHICKDLNIKLIAYSPLALGLLAIPPTCKTLPGNIIRRTIFRRLLPASINLREEMHNIAKERCVSQSQVALNWCRAHGTIPIPGIRSPKHAKDVSATYKWQLTQEEKKTLDRLSNEINVRMPNNPMQSK